MVSEYASNFGPGGEIFQQEDTKLKPIACWTRAMTNTETKYAQIEVEYLA